MAAGPVLQAAWSKWSPVLQGPLSSSCHCHALPKLVTFGWIPDLAVIWPQLRPRTRRYIAHFRSIHRGAFFAQMRTTAVRKLLPDSWGFLCPVHTPDGAPCGLLNHLAAACYVVTHPPRDTDNLRPAILQVAAARAATPGAA